MRKTTFPAGVVASEADAEADMTVFRCVRLGRIGTLLQAFHTIPSDVPTMESVAVDQRQALQFDRRKTCHACYERRILFVRVSLPGNVG